MNYRDYIIYDFETTSKYARSTQPVQIAAVVVHGRKLEIKPGSEFQSLIRPVFDIEECKRLGLDPLTDDAIAIHGKTKEMLETAPTLDAVWKNFTEYVKQYNNKGSSFTAPIAVGYNSKNYDDVITDRICTKAPYALGPVNKEGKQDLFNNIHSLDVLDLMFMFFENNPDVNSLSADNLVRGHMGYAKGTAHDAMSDVIMTAEVFCQAMKSIRYMASRKKLKGMFND